MIEPPPAGPHAADLSEPSLPTWRAGLLPFARRVVPAFLGVLLVCYLVYGWVHVLFTRAEGAWMLEASRRWASLFKMFGWAASRSYNGHYFPLFFLLELLTARFCGISEAGWRVHQLVILAVLTLALLSFFGRVAEGLVRSKSARFWLKVGLTAPLVFSPLMIEFVSWPFIAGQLLWAALTVGSLSRLTRAITQGTNGLVSLRDLGWSLACAYGSMHAFGLGAATMAAWLAVWAVLFADGWLGHAPAAYLKKLGRVGAAGLLLTAIHGGLMLFLPRYGSNTPSAHLTPGSYVTQTLGYAACLLWESLRSLGGPNSWPYPRPDAVGEDWGYGLGLFLALGSCAVGWFRAHRVRPSALGLCRVCWHVFSLVAYGTYVVLVSLRIRHQGETWLGYLLGPRYLWPSALLLVGFFASGVSCLRLENGRLVTVIALLVGGTTVLGNVVYQQTVIPKVWPWTTLSHEQSWRQIGRMSGELRRAGLPLPNLIIGKLGVDFRDPLSKYEALVRSLSCIPAGEAVHWQAAKSISPLLWRGMQEKSPALVQLSADVFAEQDASERLAFAALSEEQKRGARVLSLVDEGVLKDTTLDHVKDHPNLGVDLTVEGTTRRSVWIDAPTALTYHHLALGLHPAFRAFVAIHPAIYGQVNADGAAFQVDVRADGQTRRLADFYLNPIAHPELRRWLPLDGIFPPTRAGRWT